MQAEAGWASVVEMTFDEMTALPPVDEVLLQVHSPAVFRIAGYGDFKRRLPLPDPRLLYRRLIDEWNLLAERYPIAQGDAADFLGCLELVDWDPAMGDALLDRTEGGREVTARGFMGDVRFGVRGPRPQGAGRLLTALSVFATVAGVGAWTNRGLGACTVVLDGGS